MPIFGQKNVTSVKTIFNSSPRVLDRMHKTIGVWESILGTLESNLSFWNCCSLRVEFRSLGVEFGPLEVECMSLMAHFFPFAFYILCL